MDEKSDFNLAANPKWSHWERNCIEELLGVFACDPSGNVLDDSFDENEFVAPSGLWECFEASAHDVAALYRESSWNTFQTAAKSATQLYKESMDNYRRGIEQGLQLGEVRGRRKMLKELLGFLSRYNRKHVHREDLIGFLSGRSPPHRQMLQAVRSSPRSRLPPSVSNFDLDNRATPDYNLTMFKEALVINAFASPHSSPGRGNSRCGSPTARSPAAALPRPQQQQQQQQQDLSSFFLEEWSRNRKRSLTEVDVVMDSPPHNNGSMAKRHRNN